MKYAIVKIGSSQYKVSEGDELFVEKLAVEKDKAVELDQVLLVAESGDIKIGQPLVSGVTIKAKVTDQAKGKKIRVATYKAKSRYRRVIGHRKLITKLRIESIGGKKEIKVTKGTKATKKTTGKTEAKPVTPSRKNGQAAKMSGKAKKKKARLSPKSSPKK